MIRILQMIGSLNMGGSQAFVMNIYRNIDREKIQFDFIIDHSDHIYFKDEIERMGGKIYTLPQFTGSNFFEIQKAWNEFFSEHNEYKVIHSHIRSYASIFLSIAKKRGLSTIIHSHNTSNGSGISAIEKKILQIPLINIADYLLACSKQAGMWLYGKKVLERQNFLVVRNAINVDEFSFNEVERRRVRSQFNISDDTLVLGTAGRMSKQKNPFGIIEIADRLKKRNVNYKLLWAGSGQYEKEIKKAIKDKSLQNNVVLLGTRNDINNLMSSMDVFIFPSFWEGLPVTLVEAQASGLPIICNTNITDEVKITDLIKCVSLDYDKWCDQIMDIPIDTGKRDYYANKVKLSGFDINDVSKIIVDLYVKLNNSSI